MYRYISRKSLTGLFETCFNRYMLLSVSIHSRYSSMYRYIASVYRYSSSRTSPESFNRSILRFWYWKCSVYRYIIGMYRYIQGRKFEKWNKMMEMPGLMHQMNWKDNILIKSYIFSIGLVHLSSSKQVFKGKGKL